MELEEKTSFQERLEAEIVSMFAPLAEIFVHGGVTLDSVTEGYRKALVLATRKSLREAANDEPSKSRLALVTGLSRPAVARYLSTEPANPRKPIPAQIIQKWRSDPRWSDEDGCPIVLPFAGIRSFTELCKSVATKVRPRTYLDQFLDTGVVKETDAGIELVYDAPISISESDKLIGALNRISHQLDTTVANLKEPNSRYEQMVYYDAIPPLVAPVVDVLIRKECRDFISRVKKIFKEHEVEGADGAFDAKGIVTMQIEIPKESKL